MPAHEIEVVIEKTVRDQIKNFCAGAEERIFNYVLEHHENIAAYDLVRTCVGRITVSPDLLTIHIKPENFRKLVDKYLKVDIPSIKDTMEVTVPFKVGKAKNGAIVIQPENTKDIFDLPPPELKKLVQGIAWRDEHFAGKTLTEIAQREGGSDAHVGKCIMASFDLHVDIFSVFGKPWTRWLCAQPLDNASLAQYNITKSERSPAQPVNLLTINHVRFSARNGMCPVITRFYRKND